MSETPTIYEPNPYSVPLPEQVRHVMAVCVCCILFGLLAAISLPFELQPALTDYLGWRGGTYGDHSALATWGVCATAVGSAMGLVGLAAGAAAMHFTRWARIALIGFGIVEVIKGLVGIYFFVKIMELASSGGEMPPSVYRVTVLPEWLDWFFGALLGVYVLYVMTRPRAKEAFARGRAV